MSPLLTVQHRSMRPHSCTPPRHFMRALVMAGCTVGPRSVLLPERGALPGYGGGSGLHPPRGLRAGCRWIRTASHCRWTGQSAPPRTSSSKTRWRSAPTRRSIGPSSERPASDAAQRSTTWSTSDTTVGSARAWSLLHRPGSGFVIVEDGVVMGGQVGVVEYLDRRRCPRVRSPV